MQSMRRIANGARNWETLKRRIKAIKEERGEKSYHSESVGVLFQFLLGFLSIVDKNYRGSQALLSSTPPPVNCRGLILDCIEADCYYLA